MSKHDTDATAPDEESPAVKKAMACFHERLAEQKLAGTELREGIEKMIVHHCKGRDQERTMMNTLSPDSSNYAGSNAVKCYHEGAIAGLECALRLMDHYYGRRPG